MPERPKVFVSRRLPEAGLRRMAAVCALDVWPDRLPPPADVLGAAAADADGLVTLLTDRVDAALLDAAPRLKVVSNYAVGYNNIDVAAATARGVAVGNTPGVLTDATADLALALLLAAARRLVEGSLDAKAGRWLTWEPTGYLGQDLRGRTLGVVGMGRIGFALAQRCHAAFDMQILYCGPRRHERADLDLQATYTDFDSLLRASDFVSVHASLNDSTRGLFGAEQFAKMKRTAVFVNTARGGHVDQRALYEALKSGTIFAAGLDVTEPEPLPADDPLYSLPNCVIAPHIASATVGTRDAMAEICAENLIAGVTGQPLPAWVNPEVEPLRRR
jgi:glyoxylate reductase